jgi:hypothetical protein
MIFLWSDRGGPSSEPFIQSKKNRNTCVGPWATLDAFSLTIIETHIVKQDPNSFSNFTFFDVIQSMASARRELL